jgi:hypothetical protein
MLFERLSINWHLKKAEQVPYSQESAVRISGHLSRKINGRKILFLPADPAALGFPP